MGKSLKYKIVVGAVIAASLLASESVAMGVTLPQPPDAGEVNALTTGAAVRARADVQIRRIKMLIVSKRTTEREQDKAIDWLQKLHKDLRGQK